MVFIRGPRKVSHDSTRNAFSTSSDCWDNRIHQLYLCWELIVLNMTLNCIGLCCPNLGTLGNAEFPFIIFTSPSARAGYDTRSIFKWSLQGLNSELSFSYTSCLTKAEETSLPYYLPIAGVRIIGFIPFPRVLVLCEMLSVSSRIWTRVAESISYDDNDYTTGSFHLLPLRLGSLLHGVAVPDRSRQIEQFDPLSVCK